MADMLEFPIVDNVVVAPPLAPETQPIDRTHLFRMTLGDHALECEVLRLGNGLIVHHDRVQSVFSRAIGDYAYIAREGPVVAYYNALYDRALPQVYGYLAARVNDTAAVGGSHPTWMKRSSRRSYSVRIPRRSGA